MNEKTVLHNVHVVFFHSYLKETKKKKKKKKKKIKKKK